MERCTACGHEMAADVTICSSCGHAVLAESDVEQVSAAIPPAVPAEISIGVPAADAGESSSGAAAAEWFGEAETATSTPTPKRNISSWLIAVVGLAVVLGGVGFMMRSAFGFVLGGNETAEYVPASAQFYFAIDLLATARSVDDPRIETLLDQIGAEFDIDRAQLDEGVSGSEEEILDEIGQELGIADLNLSFEDDVASWADRYVAVFGSVELDEFAEPNDVEACFLVQARSQGQADDALERIYGELSRGDLVVTRSEAGGRIVYEWSDDVLVQAARVDDVVALCVGEDALDSVVLARASGQVLGADAQFQELEEVLDSWALFGYVNSEGLFDTLGAAGGFSTLPAQDLQVAFTTNLTDAGIEFRSAVTNTLGTQGFLASDGRPAAAILPADVYMAFGGADLGTLINNGLDAFRDSTDDADELIDDFFAEFTTETGLDLQAMIDSMIGPYGFAVSAGSNIEGLPIGGVLFTDTTNPGSFSAFLDVAADEMGVPYDSSTVGEYSVWAFDVDTLTVGAGVSDGRFVLAAEDDLVAQMANGDVLSADPRYLEAIAALPEGYGWYAYADVTKIIDAVLAEGGDDLRQEADGREIISALEIVRKRFPYLVAGVETTETVVSQSFVVVFTNDVDEGA